MWFVLTGFRNNYCLACGNNEYTVNTVSACYHKYGVLKLMRQNVFERLVGCQKCPSVYLAVSSVLNFANLAIITGAFRVMVFCLNHVHLNKMVGKIIG